MFSLVKAFGVEVALRREAAPLAIAFLIAALFFKFGNFALECAAFLAVWFVLSAAQSALVAVIRRRAADDPG